MSVSGDYFGVVKAIGGSGVRSARAVRNTRRLVCVLFLSLVLFAFWSPAKAGPGSDQQALTPLIQAIIDKNADLVKQLLAHGADPSESGQKGVSPIGEAVDANSPAIEEAVIGAIAAKPGAATELDKFGVPPIIYAAATPCINRVDLVKLRTAGADLTRSISNIDPSALGDGLNNYDQGHVGTFSGYNALHVASYLGNVNGVKALLSLGMDVDEKTADGSSPLHLAARYCNEAVPALLAAHANANAVDAYGDTPLQVAVSPVGVQTYGDTPQRVRFAQAKPIQSYDALAGLIAASDLNRENHLGLTPLMIALLSADQQLAPCFAGHVPAAGSVGDAFYDAATDNASSLSVLINKTPDLVALRLPNSWTLLQMACFHGSINAVKLLLTKRADVNAPNWASDTPLTLCMSSPFVHDDVLATYLLDHGANGDVNCSDGDTPLIKAINAQDLTLADSLIEHKVNLNNGDARYVSPLRMALKTSRPLFDKLLAAGADVNIMDCDGNTVLTDATEAGDIDLAKLLISKGAIVKRTWPTSICPLYDAIDQDRPDIFELLLQNGARLDDRLGLRISPRMHATPHPDIQAIVDKYATQQPAPPPDKTAAQLKLPDYSQGGLPLESLIERNDWVDAEKLITSYPDVAEEVSSADQDTRTVLFNVVTNASQDGSSGLVKTLIDDGNDPNGLSSENDTPLLEDLFLASPGDDPVRLNLAKALISGGADAKAAIIGPMTSHWYPYVTPRENYLFVAPNPALVALLIANGADPNGHDESGDTPLFAAKSPDVQAALLDAGADPNHIDFSGNTPLTSLLYSRNRERISQQLIEKSNLAIVNSQGMTPVRLILSQARTATWQELVGVNPKLDADSTFLAAIAQDDPVGVAKGLALNPNWANSRGPDGSTALSIAATWGAVNAAAALIASGADVNARDIAGKTPLMRAAQPLLRDTGPQAKDAVVALLIAHGADVNAVDTDKESALSIAVLRQEAGIVKLLQDNKAVQTGTANAAPPF